MPRSASTDTTYLERKSGKYCVSVAVPRSLQGKLGTRLKRALGTDSLAIANRLKWPVVWEFKAKISTEGGQGDTLLREALEVAKLRRAAEPEDTENIDFAIVERAEEVARSGVEAGGERQAIQYADIAFGRAVPIDAHHADYLKQISSSLTRRTLADDERAIRFLRKWCDEGKRAFMLQATTRRTAAQFMDDMARVTAAPSPVTHQKYLTRLSRYWRWMQDRDIVQANPWAGLRPAMKATPHDEKERPFTADELRKLLAGPATAPMHDLMRIAALTGARLDTIVDLRVRDCGDGVFTFKPQKKERGPRRVPIHSALTELVARRVADREDDDPFFPEWPPPNNPQSQRERSFKASNAFTTYRRAVGVDDTVPGRRRALVNFHSFRRWFITRAEQAGQPESIIAFVVGHTRPGMTFGRYSAGPQVDQLRACVEAVRLPGDENLG